MRPKRSPQANFQFIGWIGSIAGCGSCRILLRTRGIKSNVNPLSAILRLFVNTFGITQPEPKDEARAGRFIALMLLGVLVVLGLAAYFLRHVFAA